MVEIRLRAMADEEFPNYREEAMRLFAADQVQSDGVSEEAAMGTARASFERNLPRGLETPGHTVNWVVDAKTGARVGHLWLFLAPDAPRAYVYDILVLPEFRRRGYAEATLASAESIARAHGATRLELHVFGHNSGALALYEKLGFRTTHRMMAKPL